MWSSGSRIRSTKPLSVKKHTRRRFDVGTGLDSCGWVEDLLRGEEGFLQRGAQDDIGGRVGRSDSVCEAAASHTSIPFETRPHCQECACTSAHLVVPRNEVEHEDEGEGEESKDNDVGS